MNVERGDASDTDRSSDDSIGSSEGRVVVDKALPRKRAPRPCSPAQLAALEVGRRSRQAKSPISPAPIKLAEPAPAPAPAPEPEPEPPKTKPARKGRSDRGASRGSYIAKAVNACKELELEAKAPAKPEPVEYLPKFNFVIV
jgi:hypothetical protein